MKKTSFLLAMVALIFLASVCTPSLAILIQREEEKRDPTTGYDPPPGESFCWAYQYGEYEVETEKYYNIDQDYDYGWKEGTGNYAGYSNSEKDTYHPSIETFVIYYPVGGPPIGDTYVKIEW